MPDASRDPDAPLRVAFLIDRWRPERGGAEAALAGFARHLEARGHEVHAVGAQGPTAEHPAPGTFQAVRPRGVTRGARERDLADRMLARADELAVDCTIGVRHLPRVDLWWPHGGSHAETLRLAGRAPRGRHRTFLELERELANGGARRIVCVSELVREELARWYPACADRLVVVPNGVDVERFHPRERAGARAGLLAACGWPDDAPLLAFVGRNPRLKGLDVLLQALEPLRDRRWRLVVAGPRRPGPWRALARRLGMGEDRVAVREQLDGLDLAAGADLLVLPSRRDPCPLSVLEALACGTPALVGERVGARDALRSDEAGAVVAPLEDRAAWTRALRERLARLHAAPPDRDAVRACVRDRSAQKWWMRLEQLTAETAACRPSTTHQP